VSAASRSPIRESVDKRTFAHRMSAWVSPKPGMSGNAARLKGFSRDPLLLRGFVRITLRLTTPPSERLSVDATFKQTLFVELRTKVALEFPSKNENVRNLPRYPGNPFQDVRVFSSCSQAVLDSGNPIAPVTAFRNRTAGVVFANSATLAAIPPVSSRNLRFNIEMAHSL